MDGHGDEWYENAVIYAVDVEAFQDGDGDGVGDFAGLTSRLDYLAHLGVDCLWVLPFYPSPNRDNGYDVADYYGVDPSYGTLGDFVDFVQAADERGIRVLIDLVINHTSDEHPWFRKARSGEEPYRDYYVWTDEPPAADPDRASVFPGEVDDGRVWTWDDEAGAYYYHRFYPFQPDLRITNPDVREEIRKIMHFWLQLGVSSFRIDAATLMIQAKHPDEPGPDDPFALLQELRSYATRYRGDVVLLAEADDDPELLPAYGRGESGGGMDLLLNFPLSAHLFAALAMERGDPLVELFEGLPDLPAGSQWASFLRNYDELNLGRLPDEYREPTFERFAPEEGMRIYDRGIRRRLAPMLDGDQRRVRLAFSLLFSMPGSPLVVYGDEIGMGEDLSLPGRTAVRTPMQWSDTENGGFSTAPAEDLVRPVVTDGPFGAAHVNVADQWATADSLLNFVEHLVGTRHEASEVGRGTMTVLETDAPAVFAHRFDDDGSTVAVAHNLAEEPVTVSLALGSGGGDDGDGGGDDTGDGGGGTVIDLLGSGEIRQRDDGRVEVDLGEYGYRWLRISR